MFKAHVPPVLHAWPPSLPVVGISPSGAETNPKNSRYLLQIQNSESRACVLARKRVRNEPPNRTYPKTLCSTTVALRLSVGRSRFSLRNDQRVLVMYKRCVSSRSLFKFKIRCAWRCKGFSYLVRAVYRPPNDATVSENPRGASLVAGLRDERQRAFSRQRFARPLFSFSWNFKSRASVQYSVYAGLPPLSAAAVGLVHTPLRVLLLLWLLFVTAFHSPLPIQ